VNGKYRVALVALIFFGACGGAGSGISGSAGAVLHAEVAAIRAAAAHGESQTAVAELAQLRASVVQLRAGGLLSAAATARILSAAQTVQTQLALLPAPTTTTTTTTSPTTSTTTTSSTTTTTTTTIPSSAPSKHRNGNGHDRRGNHHSQD